MSRQADLEQHIHQSYDLAREYEAIFQIASDPKEKARARRAIEEQWALIKSYLAEYRRLAGDVLPAEMAQIAARFAPTLHAPDYAAARARYLAALRERYNVIETHGFMETVRDERVGKPHRLPLLGQEGVYVPLLFDAPAGRPGPALDPVEGRAKNRPVEEAYLREWADREMRPLSLSGVIQLPGHLAIIGYAGSGKTTLLHVLVSALAARDPRAAASDLAAVLPDPRPLPVFLPLRLFERACGEDDAPGDYARCAADLLRFVDDWFARWCPAADLPPGFLADHIRGGRAWFLLDALDEVPDAAHRETVRNVIQELAGFDYGTRLLVTARLAAYRGARLDDRFAVVTVRDLDEEQRARMVHALYGGMALVDADRRAAGLSEQIRHSEALRDLTRTPVMVWTTAVIHALRGELPDSRAALYDAYVDILLKHSFKRTRYDAAAVDALTGGQGWPLPDRRHYLTYAAFQVHRMLEAQPERRGERHVVVGEQELADEVLARYFQKNLGLAYPRARRRARKFLNLMTERSGLLYETDQGYTIGDHLTMQEFLAGCYLGEHYPWEDATGYAAFLQEKVERTWWREVFLLAAGYLAEKPGFAARQFLQQVAGQGETPAARLAALALAGQGLLQLRTRLRRPTWYANLAQELANRLYRLLYAEPAAAPVAARQDAGLVLGLLYGYPGEGGLPDPRFSHPGGLPDFVRIAGGPFWMGDDDSPRKNERPRHRVTLDAFELARFPTTNAMFAHFVSDGGYGEQRWWAEAIADSKWADGKVKDFAGERTEPLFWNDPRFDNPAQPVMGVTWYEAVAYCAWLTATLDDGYTYRLPTEAEWERAARGSEGWTFPWGDEWQADRCNSEETGLGTTSPVGLFPRGATGSGLQDMAGNVWEWCRDWYAGDYYVRSRDGHNPSGPKEGVFHVLRGGSGWNKGPSACRCGYRGRIYPDDWFLNWGFRCARTLSSQSLSVVL